MTLVEVMVAMGISSMALLATASLSFYTARSFAAISNYVDLDKHSRNALDRISQMIRQADGVTDFSAHEISFSYEHTNTLTFRYSEATKELAQIYKGETRTLLTECDYLNFEIFQRNPINGSYDQYPATLTNNAAKIVQVTWLCSRSILGKMVNTESVQSAKIVIRKQ
mgnify:CR=1 FL=1